MHPIISLWIEDSPMQVPTKSRHVALPGPGRTATLVVHIREARGWTIEVLRNGLAEAMEPPRYIMTDEYCTTFQRIMHTCCTLQVRCVSRDGRSLFSEPIRILLQSGVWLAPSDEALAIDDSL
jgi:hypothetical protein